MAKKAAVPKPQHLARAARRSQALLPEANDSLLKDDKDEGSEPADLATLIEVERATLLEAHSLMQCLKEVLTEADFDAALFYADLAGVAAKIVDASVARLDATRVLPMIEALRPALRAKARPARPRVGPPAGKFEVREAGPAYLC